MASEAKARRGPKKARWTAMTYFHIALFALLVLVCWRVSPQVEIGLLYLLWLGAMFVSVALHEGGHAIAGLVAGFNILAYAVWPVEVRFQSKSSPIRWFRRPGMLGFVAVDSASAENLRKRMAIWVAGGPAASVVAGAVAFLMFLVAQNMWPDWALAFLKLIGWWCVYTVLTSAVPYAGKLAANDAARFQMLWTGGDEAERFCRMVLLSNASRNGVRPRDLNAEMVATLPGPVDISVDWVWAELTRVNILSDSGRAQEGWAILMSVLDQDLAPQTREVLQLQAVWFEARQNRNLEGAREWLSLSPIKKRKDDTYVMTLYRAQASIAFLVQRWDDAESAARLALRACNRLDDLGTAILVREGIEGLLAEIADARAGKLTAADSMPTG